ncbi:basic leucine zipper transcriptional factor ATF-like 3 isoform X1 [Dermochelys coriacea]|uniref:basic leucine zipper transcriptional factor ATF-like 3 isoform X1 n=1 Tax=Dermochelys coriacea TaxID=27794 RepID=UPI001CA8FC2F|nr:basic leucine zipper transcriptional factor ATF-like 3 isoform X1 [Dermochelys coriacea]
MSHGVPASGSVLQRSASSDGNQPQSPEEDDRKIRRREKNRVAAQRSRKKQTQKADKLHEAIQNCLLQPAEDVSCVEGSLDGVELLNHPSLQPMQRAWLGKEAGYSGHSPHSCNPWFPEWSLWAIASKHNLEHP